MRIPWPLVQDGAVSAPAIDGAGPALEPFITGPATALWVGFGAFIIIMVLMLMIIIRGRVIVPARRKAMDSNFFEPAGDGAEISFEEPAPEPKKSKRNKRKSRKEKREKQTAKKTWGDEGDLNIADNENGEALAQNEEREHSSRAPFAELFAKKQNEAEVDHHPEDISGAAHPHPIEHGANDEYSDEDHSERDSEDTWRSLEAEHAAQETAREAEAEEARQQEAEAEEREQIYRTAREEAGREAEFERRKAEAALEHRMQSLSAMQHKLSEKADSMRSDADAVQHRLDASIEERFAALADQLNEKLADASTHITTGDAPSKPNPEFAELAAYISNEISALKEKTDTAFKELSARINKLDAAPDGVAALSREIAGLNRLLARRSAATTAGRIQLTDLVRSALPADRYVFSKKLSTGGVADCLIYTQSAPNPIAVDARFPVDEFDTYARVQADESRDETAKNGYRRSVLRHIVEIAEKLIAPEETADFAVMFVPSETIFSDLHANFTDLVQDSYRARVWIVSPTSMMASLHMMSAMAMPAPISERNTPPGREEIALTAELELLRRRVATLEGDPAIPEPTSRDDITPDLFKAGYPAAQETAAPVVQFRENDNSASPPPENFNEGGDYFEDEENLDPTPASPVKRPPFPLRSAD